MNVRLLQVILTVALALVFVGTGLAQEAAKDTAVTKVTHTYVGVKQCKICHKKDGIFDSWSATKHATVWDSLSADNQKNEAYKPFYTTGMADSVLLTGVQCEACHGPGSDYKKKSIMENKEAAIAAGLVIPDAKVCAKCHNEKAPGKLAATAKDFDFAKMKEKGVHAKAVKAEAGK
jgi:mono/diheme cytochrome c family protein